VSPGLFGVLGGTFDPVHYGHLRAADAVRARLALDAVALVPAGRPSHRGAPGASAEDRLAMLELGVREFPGLAVDAREIARPGPSYTVPTLESMRAEAPQRHLALILGSDAFAGLPTWHRWQALFDLAHLVVVTRPGFEPVFDREPLASEFRARRVDDPARLESARAGSIYLLPIPPQPISSTAVRQGLARGSDGQAAVRAMVPPAVLAYIDRHALYRPPPDAS